MIDHMKAYIPLLFVSALLLSACGSLPTNLWPQSMGGSTESYQMAESHAKDVEAIRVEANRLGMLVGKEELTKVQAAQLLNRFRLKTAGSNTVDDSVFSVYLRSTVESQNGKITGLQSKQIIQTSLETWQVRWPTMKDKPKNPAFTNFLLQHLGMTPLK
ncbi:MAG: prokaryotic membrane lipolipid attachment site family protein [Neisseriaceae bacterium]|nr:prokaryotic membrane lipolipid attachment site family protein [Neisseriaceae bacterium]MBP6863372.1 prokaryotic membrane lipolipid attachment site family protein [Neisseriaceae bacterium]